jgi:hypothetical protein
LDAAAARNRGFFDILVGRHGSVARAAQVYADRSDDAVEAITQLERPDAYVGLLFDATAALRLSVFGAGVEPALSDVLRRLVDQRAGMAAHEANPWLWLADTEAELYGDIQRADSDAARRQSTVLQATAITQARALRICREELLKMVRAAIEQRRAHYFLGHGWVTDQAHAVLRRALMPPSVPETRCTGVTRRDAGSAGFWTRLRAEERTGRIDCLNWP